jgi:hypothetical protein
LEEIKRLNRKPKSYKITKEQVKYAIQKLKENEQITKGVKHYIFWFNNICSMDNALSICKKELGDNIIIFCNTFNLKSVKDINHYHIILQN